MTKYIIGIIYSIFDEIRGPIPYIWNNDELSYELLEIVASSSLAIENTQEKTSKQLSIIPFPSFNVKILTKCIHYEDEQLRGGQGFCSISLVFNEENDMIFYKYIKHFEEIFNVFSRKLIELEENHSEIDDIRLNIQKFHERLDKLLLTFKHKETLTKSSNNWDPLKTYKIIICGDINVGKTSLVLRYTNNAFNHDYMATIGVNIYSKKLSFDENGQEFVITLWDIAGQNRFSVFRQVYYAGASGFILVFDISDKNSFHAMKEWYKDIRKILPQIPGILIGNKKDLDQSRNVSLEELTDMGRKLKLPILETSALTGENVENLFNGVGKNVYLLFNS